MYKKLLSIVLALTMVLSVLIVVPFTANATEILIPTANDNLCEKLRSYSSLVPLDSGYMRVFYDDNKIKIEYYDDSFNIKSKKSVDMELDIWGGFYAGQDGYYVVEGQNNTSEDDSAEVFRVIRYDANWNKTGTAKITSNPSLFGGEVRYPFDHGCVEMTEYNGKLYIVTGHEGYVDSRYGQGHQGFLMITIDESTMTGKITDCDLWHSFAQYIKNKDSDIYVLEQSEGSMYTKLSKFNTAGVSEKSIAILEYGGTRTSAWSIPCYASVDGLALSDDNILSVGTSIDQSQYDSVTSDTSHNIYLTVTPMSNFSQDATEIKWLTSFNDNGKCFLGLKITKVNDNRFMISWEEYKSSQTPLIDDCLSESILHYLFIDGCGNVVSDEYTAVAPISECQPVVKGSKITYYASNSNMVNFYTIDSQSGSFSKKAYRVAGENAIWELKDGTMTISGTGEISVDTDVHFRYPLSSPVNSYSYYSSDNAWKAIRDNVEKMVISEGITKIPDNEFSWFDNLTEVSIGNGMKSIGAKAFYSCDNLSKITIPSSVTYLGEDCLWSGYYYVSDNKHIVFATIYAPCGSYAIEYAKNNNISYELVGHTYGDWTITKAATCTESGTKTRKCISCGVEETDTISATGHTESDWIIDKNAQIGVTGSKHKECTVCGEVLETEIIPALTAVNLSSCTISGISNKTYTGSAITQKITVKYGSKVLINGKDYTVTYTNNKNVGTAKITIKGKGDYTGTVNKSFIIYPAKQEIRKLETRYKGFCVDWIKTSYATGYEIQYSSNSNFTNAKTVKINSKTPSQKLIDRLSGGTRYYVRVRTYTTVSGKTYRGAWSNTKSIFTASKNFSNVTVLGISDKTYTGTAITQKLTVKYGSKILRNGTDYTVKYSDNKKIGKAVITLTGKGSYGGVITRTFKINPVKQNIQKLTAKSKAFYIDWNTNNTATGYEIQYSTNSRFTNSKMLRITNYRTDRTTISNLSGNVRYYVRVRSYTTVNGTKYYGDWSSVKNVTTNK